jgi:excisionase family DNA binding protein
MMDTQTGESRMQVTITEAAQLLGLSAKTVRRRVLNGTLPGTQMATHNGYTWMVELPDNAAEPDNGEMQALRDRIQSLEVELEARRREVQELHVLLQQAQSALPPPRNGHRWWKFWR